MWHAYKSTTNLVVVKLFSRSFVAENGGANVTCWRTMTKEQNKYVEISGKSLFEMRDRLSMSQASLGAKAGLSAQQVSNIERGVTKQVYRDTLSSIAEALGIPADQARDRLSAAATASTPITPPTPSQPVRYHEQMRPLSVREDTRATLAAYIEKHGESKLRDLVRKALEKEKKG